MSSNAEKAMDFLRSLDPLTQKEFKLHAILMGNIRDHEERKNGPWEYDPAEKTRLMERRIRRLRRILAQLESLAPWTVLGRSNTAPGRPGAAPGQTTPISVRQQFVNQHYHFVEDPFPTYPSTDSSSSDED